MDDIDSDAGNQKGMEIDVDEWATINLDHEDFPPSQVSQAPQQPSLKEQLQRQKRTYKKRAFAAPATPAGAPISQDLTDVPSPFQHKRAKRSRPPAPSVATSSTSTTSNSTPVCYKCDQPLPGKTETRALMPISCHICRATFHLQCIGRRCAPRHGWACEGCTLDLSPNP